MMLRFRLSALPFLTNPNQSYPILTIFPPAKAAADKAAHEEAKAAADKAANPTTLTMTLTLTPDTEVDP